MTFNPLAERYDDDFTYSPIARYLRERVQARLLYHFQPGDHVLELGCGTGEDALFLANRGIHVTATDASPAMLATARAKVHNHPNITFHLLDLNALPPQPTSQRYDGVFSNFGPLNCIDDWRPLAVWLAERLKPGGIAAFALMSPYCMWEIGWHSLHGDFKTAFRRLRGTATFQATAGSPTVRISYPTIRRLSTDFTPAFQRVHVNGLGIALPPSDVYTLIENRPRLLKFLIRLEEELSVKSKLAPLADHYWIELQRR
jgi:SAM-dependent methyltransferase